MEEILEKIEIEIANIKEQQQEAQMLTEKSETIRKEEEQLRQEQNSMEDKESGFYKDLSKKIEEKHSEFIMANNDRMNKNRNIEQIIFGKKAEIKSLLEDKKKYIDENRNVDVSGVNFEELKAEKEQIEKEIALNNTIKEEFLKLSDSEKQDVRKAKERYLINKHRLAEISPTVELLETLDGKTPRDRYLEIDSYEKMIDENFNEKGLDKILESLNLQKENKKEQPEENSNIKNLKSNWKEIKEKAEKQLETVISKENSTVRQEQGTQKPVIPPFLKDYASRKKSNNVKYDEKLPESLKVTINARTGRYEIIDENTDKIKMSMDINKRFLNKRNMEEREIMIQNQYNKSINTKMYPIDINLLNLYEKYDAEYNTNFAETYIKEIGETNPNMPTKVEYDLRARNDESEKEKGNVRMGILAKFRLKGIAKSHEMMNLAEVKEDPKANIFDRILTGVSNIKNKFNKTIEAKKEAPKLNAPEKKNNLRDTIEKVDVSEEKAIKSANDKAQEQRAEDVKDIMSQDEH